MDTLVARYSRPAALTRETYAEDFQDELHDDNTHNLSLKFAMPPVAQVSSSPAPSATCWSSLPPLQCGQQHPSTFHHELTMFSSTALGMAPSSNRRPCQPAMPHQDCPWYHHPRLPLPGRHHRRHRFSSHGRQLDCLADRQEGD
jgi:hypothetical protein